MSGPEQEDDLDKPPDRAICGTLRMRGKLLGIWRTRFCWLDSNRFHIAKARSSPDPPRVIVIEKTTEIKFHYAKSQMTIKSSTGKLVFTGPRPEIQSWVFALRVCTSGPKMNMDHFRIIAVLGRGFYGKVMLVEKLDTGDLFALKTIRKKKLFDLDQLNTVLAERTLLSTVPKFPFIVNLAFAFQTEYKFYLGLEYAPGGELLPYLRSMPVLAIEDTRLYLAELVLALEHLHKNQVIYRDLKPENVLLSKTGHVKLADFGLSKQVESPGSTASTICGTPEYIAPEIVRREEYGFKVDWWALGVMFFEIMFGESPFWDESVEQTFHNILNTEPEYPKFGHKAAVDLMRRLLVKDPAARIDVEEIKAHAFFHGLDWEKVVRLEIRPQSFREVANEYEPNLFSSTFTRETPRDSEALTKQPPGMTVSGFSFGGNSEIE